MMPAVLRKDEQAVDSWQVILLTPLILPKQADIFRAAFAMDNHWSLRRSC
jgi:hypothetical protein